MLFKTLPVKIKLYGLYRLPFRWRDDCLFLHFRRLSNFTHKISYAFNMVTCFVCLLCLSRNCITPAMAVEKIKRTLASLLERPEYLLDTPRNSITRKAAKELLESMESDSHGNLFREFAIGLETAIKKAFPTRMPKRSAKEKVLSRFHFVR